MFVRVKKIGPYEYLYLVENVREGGRHVQRVIKALGRRDAVENSDLLDGLIASAARHSRRSIVLSSFYRGELGPLLLERPRWGAAALFYLMYAGGTLFFAVAPGAEHGTWLRTLVCGALLGLVCYGTYDLSNLATLRGWSTTAVAVDMAWGIVVTALAAVAGHGALRAAGG